MLLASTLVDDNPHKKTVLTSSKLGLPDIVLGLDAV